jgi:hypothetical protein
LENLSHTHIHYHFRSPAKGTPAKAAPKAASPAKAAAPSPAKASPAKVAKPKATKKSPKAKAGKKSPAKKVKLARSLSSRRRTGSTNNRTGCPQEEVNGQMMSGTCRQLLAFASKQRSRQILIETKKNSENVRNIARAAPLFCSATEK